MNKFRVLIVDDNKEACEVIHAVMTASNLDPVMETSSSRAAEFLGKEKYDALFFDIHMPAPDGLQLARLARTSGFNRKTPIIMVTGESGPEAMSRAFEAGANFFLFKPFDRGRLMRLMRAVRGPIEQERRRFHRVNVARHAVVQFGDQTVEGETVDISLQGILMEAPRLFPMGSTVNVQIEIAQGGKPVAGVGKVVRHAGPKRMGIELNTLPIQESERLQAFLLPLILNSIGGE
jgi:two-component system chemotaxis response regulator CheY